MKEDIGDEAVISGVIPGPYTLLLYLIEPGGLFAEMKREPNAVLEALFHLSSFLAQIGNAYREAGADYGAILREIEVAREKVEEGNEAVDIEFHISLVDMVKDIEGKMDDLGRRAPTVPQRIFADHLAALPENKSLRDKKKEAERKKKEAKRTAPVK